MEAPSRRREPVSWLSRLLAPNRASVVALVAAQALCPWLGAARAEDRMKMPVAPRGRPAHHAFADADRSAQLTALRLRYLRERRREGLALLAWGSLNVLGGSIAAGIKHDDQAWLSASVTTLGFGLINALLSLPLLDLSGHRRALVEREQSQPPMSIERLHQREAAAQLKSGQVFALNAGLDLVYLATGAFLLAMSQRDTRHAEWERGVGAAFLVQAPFLLGFDIGCWIRANRRAATLSGQR
ncbi:MAG TPA: hypothetical protein VFZ61_20995 [Polyangiales bacterium]